MCAVEGGRKSNRRGSSNKSILNNEKRWIVYFRLTKNTVGHFIENTDFLTLLLCYTFVR